MPNLSLRLMLAVACSMSPFACMAADIGISPTRLIVTPAQRVGTFTLRNNDSVSLDFQVSLKRWTMREGGEWLLEDAAPGEAPSVYPLGFRVEPGKAQVIRVGIGRDLQVADEQAFRLLVLELPRERVPGSAGGPQLLNQFSLPVFVNDGSPAPTPRIGNGRVDNGSWQFAFGIVGDGHLDPGEVKVRFLDAAGSEISVAPLQLPYVLRGASVTLEVPMGRACGSATRYVFQGGPLNGLDGVLPDRQLRRCGR